MAKVAMPEHVLQVGQAHLEAWGPSEALQVVGKALPKRPGFDTMTGRARYAFDVQLPGMLYGAIVRSTEARARVVAIDTNEATKIPGVRTILTPQNFPTFPGQGRPAVSDQVCFVGEEIAAVAADTEYVAREAVRAMKVRYEKYHAVIEPEEAMQPSAPPLTPTGNIGGGGPEIYERGSLQQGEAEADAVYEQRYATEVQHHNPLEPHGCVASWQGQELVLWDSNQGVHMVKDGLAQALGLPINRIRVINAHTGGGFGSKNGLEPYHIIAAVLSQRTGRPVCLFMNREEEFIASHHRAKSRHIIRAGVKQDGILTSIDHRIIRQASPDPEGIRLAVAGADCTRHLYQWPHMKIELYKVLTNTQSPIPCRGPTAAEDLFCFEQFIDELAHMLKIEPLVFRLQNYAEIDPVDNRPYSSKGLKACYEQGAKAFGWGWRPPRTVREGSKYRGIGLGSVVFHGTPGEQSEAMVVLHNDGTAQVVAGIAEIGVGAETVFAQIAAEELGIPVEHVSVSYGDAQTTPYTINSSYGSRTTTIGGPAVRAAAFEAKRQLLVLAARELGVAPDTLTIKDAQNIVCLKKGGSTCGAVDGDNRYYHAILEGGPCYIVHPSDMAPALIALGAQMHILGPKGPRSLPLEEFFVTTVQRLYQENVLEREEIITALTVPSMSSEMKQVFLKSRIRQADEFSLAAVALAARVQAGTCIDCRVVLGGVAPRPYRATAAEEAIKGSPLTAEQINKAAAAALAAAKPMAMNTYKLDLTRGLVVRAFEQVA